MKFKATGFSIVFLLIHGFLGYKQRNKVFLLTNSVTYSKPKNGQCYAKIRNFRTLQPKVIIDVVNKIGDQSEYQNPKIQQTKIAIMKI